MAEGYKEWRLLNALFAAILNFATSHSARQLSNGRCPLGMFIYPVSRVLFCMKGCGYGYGTYQRGLLALLVRTEWAMRRPRVAGRVTGKNSHAFFIPKIIVKQQLITNILIGSVGIDKRINMKNLFLTALFMAMTTGTVHAQRGSCGTGVSWTLSEGTLTISGTGEMSDDGNLSYSIYKDNVTNVVIEEGVSHVGRYAFQNFTNLQSLSLAEGVVSIGQYAFNNCQGLEEVIFPSTTRQIYQNAFSGTGLKTVTIPEGVEEIEGGIFSDCPNLTVLNWNARNCDLGWCVLWNHRKFPQSGYVKEVHFGENVERIPGNILASCDSLVTVTTCGSVSKVGEEAFDGTQWYDNQPDGLLYIDNALYDYKGQMDRPTAIIVKEGTESITGTAFRSCNYLTDITIPSTLKSIGDYAFGGCSALGHVTWNAIACEDFKNDYSFNPPFKDASLYEVTLGDHVKYLPYGLFGKCTGLEIINFPASLQVIGDMAFHSCSALKEVKLSSSDLQSIGENAFYGCSALENVEFPTTLQSIGEQAFSGCEVLDNVVIPEGLKKICQNAFWGADGLKNVTYNAILCEVEGRGNDSPFGGKIENLTIGDKVTYIPKSLFNSRGNFSELVIPNSVEEIQYSAFYNCGITSLTIGENVKKIGRNAFDQNDIKELTWNAVSVKDVENNDSRYIKSTVIERCVLGAKVKRIPNYLCYGCIQLSEVTIPEGVDSIGSYAFNGCSGLTKVVIPNSVTSVSGFGNCSGLQEIEVGEGVVDFNAFGGCSNLKKVTWNAVGCTYGTLPQSIETITFGDKVETLPKRFCKDCRMLTDVVLPASLTSLGESAFYGCRSLTKIDIPALLDTIPSNAFSSCGLAKQYIPATVKKIERNAFDNNDYLSEVIVAADGVLEAQSPFDNCFSLANIYVADEAAYKADAAWSGRKNLIKPMVAFAENNWVYSGIAPQPAYTNNLTDYTLQLEMPELDKNAGTYSHHFVADFKGEHSFSVHIPYAYTIEKAQLTLTPDQTEKVYGDEEPVIGYTLEGLVNNETAEEAYEELPRLTASTTKTSSVGKNYRITFADEPVSRNYNTLLVESYLAVTPKELQVSVQDEVRRYGEGNPVFTIVYDGFVNDEDESVISAPRTYCEAYEESPVGEYEIALSGGYARNYTFVLTNGVLRIQKAVQEIVWEQTLQDLFVGDTIRLQATSTSGLLVSFETDDTDICTIEFEDGEYFLAVKAAGTAHVRALQAGDENHEAAETVVREIIVSVGTGIADYSDDRAKVFASGHEIVVCDATPGAPVSVYSSDGVLLHKEIANGENLRFAANKASVYIVRVDRKSYKVMIKR